MVKKNVVKFKTPLSVEYYEELYRRVFFISSEILEFEILIENENIVGLEISSENTPNIRKISNNINKVVENEISTQKILNSNKIWENKEDREYHEDVFDNLKRNKVITIGGEGQVGFGEPLIKLMDYLDARIMKIIGDLFKAEEFRYPTLIPTKVIEKCGCLDSFPQLLMFVSSLHNDLENYEKFNFEFKKEHKTNHYVKNHLGNVDYCLPPTMCYHTYHQFKDSIFTNGFNKVITSKGKSFRHESRYQKTIERLWDFTIREIVFLGNQDFVTDCRQKLMKASFSLMEDLGLNGHAEIANDPFFASPEAVLKTFNQRLQTLKFELRINLNKKNTISVASFNYHENFFSKNFNIKYDNEDYIVTGCAGFGLERLMFAYIVQHGVDESNWPIKL
ncbi:hypothetical protein MQE36_14655 [Zhouia spongiae]|uniref:Aminoacyl-transfer RNA synthetases class-II family profile domain-containing protein n=1 Tax=Zhouia spongiae TaxID=2202721 RepID=A0ABY3YMC8_9FLAO|nr:aminoacyl--tRNA ligase-related protein [Zhouia spongiae]UNY98313.1 hypothetical protein MQE36_14655 [Zhouia spongiae]